MMYGLNSILEFGPYQNRTIQYVINNDPDYLLSLVEDGAIELSAVASQELDEALYEVEFDEESY